MRIIHLITLAALITFSSCGSKPAVTTTATTPKAPVSSNLGAEGTTRLMSVADKYYTLKDAMVAANAANATTAATALATATDSLQAYLAKDAASATALKPYTDTIITQSRLAAGINDVTCEQQRIAFSPISSAMYGLLRQAGIKNAGIYHQYCPMAFNDKGATWLSMESDIKNPYFGKKMLECGETTDTLK